MTVTIENESNRQCRQEKLPSPGGKTSDEYLVRDFEPQDIVEVIRMQKALQKDSARVNRDLWKMEGDYITHLQNYYRVMFEDKSSRLVVVQDEKNECLVGMGMGRIFQHEIYSPGISGELIDVWVEPEHRRKGIAKK